MIKRILNFFGLQSENDALLNSKDGLIKDAVILNDMHTIIKYHLNNEPAPTFGRVLCVKLNPFGGSAYVSHTSKGFTMVYRVTFTTYVDANNRTIVNIKSVTIASPLWNCNDLE